MRSYVVTVQWYRGNLRLIDWLYFQAEYLTREVLVDEMSRFAADNRIMTRVVPINIYGEAAKSEPAF